MIRRPPKASSGWSARSPPILTMRRHGKPSDADELIAAHPDLANDLRQFLDDHQRIMRVANSV